MVKMVVIAVLAFSGLSMNSQNLDDILFGTDTTFELVTWNIERYPKNGITTVQYVTDIIEAMDVDLLALQEIDDKTGFEYLVQGLVGWDGYYVDSEYSGLAYLYKSDVIEVLDTFQIYTNLWREFPRPPFVMELMYKDQFYVVINNHFKCCGDGDLEANDSWDEETRRMHASNLIDAYVNTNYSEEPVIVLGDLNDILTDGPSDNVFKVFMDADDEYQFVDMDIAKGDTSAWSFPSWPSHIDHILITNELFNELENENLTVQTIEIDQFLDGGFDEYDDNVSDHRPVALKIQTNSDVVSTSNLSDINFQLLNYPNPFRGITTISFDSVPARCEINIYNSDHFKCLLNDFFVFVCVLGIHLAA